MYNNNIKNLLYLYIWVRFLVLEGTTEPNQTEPTTPAIDGRASST